MICTAWGYPGARYPDTWTWGDEKPPSDASGGVPVEPANGHEEYKPTLSPQEQRLLVKSGKIIENAKGQKPKPNMFGLTLTANGTPPGNRMVPLHRWEADRRDNALAYFVSLQKNGIPWDNPQKLTHAPSKIWRFRGAPGYLEKQIHRLKLPQTILKKAQSNKEVCQASSLLGQLSEMLVKITPKGGGLPTLNPHQVDSVAAALDQAETFVAVLGVSSAALADAIDEARAAYGQPPKQREFGLISIYDQPAHTNGKSHTHEGSS